MGVSSWKLRLYTGPVAVKELANKARRYGYEVDCEGTEHLHVWVSDLGDGWGAVGAEERLRHVLGLHEMGFPLVGGLSEILQERSS